MNFDSDPFDPFRMMKRIEKHFSNLGANVGMKNFGNTREPLVDITENAKEVKVIVEIPGLEKKDIDLRVKDNYLIINATIKRTKDNQDEDTLYQERSYHQYSRTVPLPEYADSSKIDANYNNGILELTMPKKKGTTKPDKIVIK